MSRHGHHRVRLVLSMTLSNAEAISHMAYGMLYLRPYVHQWSRVAHIAPAIAPEKKDEGEEERKDGWRGKSAHLEKRAVSPSMLLLRDKAEDADIRAYSRCS
ncbi:Nuclear receptor subfamily 2 group F member 1-A [Temnothorax longispinosus]|uniref:Nuclear receptor subfamily 2 group F member 1-A n=1 Tax=Temnothorax longispinosus TaxID=300112 RepID=A0A4V6RGJ8_9HYME|nr:Nuclear receptor subfamily 2 group F member 1-A [Temnothorax longispinosus]